MAYDIQTKDGIIIRDIPDDISPDNPNVIAKVAMARAQKMRESAKSSVENDAISQGAKNFNADSGFLSNVAAGAGKAVSDIGLGIRQLFGAASQEEVDETAKRDRALMSSGGGLTGNIGTQVGMALMPGAAAANVGKLSGLAGLEAAGKMLLSSPATVTGALTQGALGGSMAALQPVKTSETRGGNAAIGTVGGMIVPVAGMAFKGAKAAIEPGYQGGRKQILSRLFNEAAGDGAPDAIRRLESAGELVKGSAPTAAEVAESGGISALQRAASAIDPEAYTKRGMDQAAARIQAIREIAGDAQTLAAAESARKKATAPLYKAVSESEALADPGRVVSLIDRIIKQNPARDAVTGPLSKVRESLFEEYPLAQRAADAWKEINSVVGKRMSASDFNAVQNTRLLMDRVKKGTVGADEALEKLKGISATSKTASDAIDYAKQLIKTPDYVLRQNPQALQSASKNIGDLITSKGPSGAPVNEAIVRELSIIKKSLDHQISKAEPAYGQAQKAFADLSKTINQMEVGQYLMDKVSPAMADYGALARETGNKFTEAMRNAEQTARLSTGFKRATLDKIMTPEQMQTLTAVAKDLARKSNAQDLGRGVGSNTVQNLSMTNLMQRAGVPVGLVNSPLLGAVGNFAYSASDKKLKAELAQALLDPKFTAEIMKLAPSQRQQAVNNFLRMGLTPLATGATTTALNVQ